MIILQIIIITLTLIFLKIPLITSVHQTVGISLIKSINSVMMML